MGQNRYEKSVELPASVEEAFAWHEREGAFERLTPPWVRARVVDRYGGIQDGGEVTIELRKGPCKWRWVAMHQNYTQDVRFQDIQVTGPFAAWCHTHRFESLGDSQSRITDTISYRLPLGFLGEFFAGKLIRHDLERMFAWRHGVTASDLAAHQRYATAPRRKILISGASGLVGRNLSAFLSTGGHDVWHLTRQLRGESKRQIVWDTEQIAPETLEPFDTVIHLAGENIFGLWTAGKFRRIRDSRVNSTRALAQALARFPQGTKNFICASAIGFYGSRGDECLDESSYPGGNLLAQIAREWEAATQPAIDAGVRVALMRLGVVLTPQRGSLWAKCFRPFRWGWGGRIGSGPANGWAGCRSRMSLAHFIMP